MCIHFVRVGKSARRTGVRFGRDSVACVGRALPHQPADTPRQR